MKKRVISFVLTLLFIFTPIILLSCNKNAPPAVNNDGGDQTGDDQTSTKFSYVPKAYRNLEFSKYITISDYKGVELSEAKVQEKLNENIDGILDQLSAQNQTEYTALTDELVKSGAETIKEYLGLDVEFETVEELKTYLRHQIEINQVWNAITGAVEVKDYPEKFIQQQRDHYDSMYLAIMEENGITSWEDLFTQMNTTEDAYISTRQSYAEGVVKEELILYYIILTEEIDMSESDYKAKGETLAVEGGYEDLKDYENSIGKDLVERTVHWEIVKEYLLSKATKIS